MLKKLVASVVVLLGVAFAVAWFYLDRLVVDGIELVGTEVLGTEVAVQSASISPLAGTGSIQVGAQKRFLNSSRFQSMSTLPAFSPRWLKSTQL